MNQTRGFMITLALFGTLCAGLPRVGAFGEPAPAVQRAGVE
jgi:hypothetical protein